MLATIISVVDDVTIYEQRLKKQMVDSTGFFAAPPHHQRALLLRGDVEGIATVIGTREDNSARTDRCPHRSEISKEGCP